MLGTPPVLSKAVRLRRRRSRADAVVLPFGPCRRRQRLLRLLRQKRRFTQSADPSLCAARRFPPGIESKCRKERVQKLIEEPGLSLGTAIESTDICMHSMWSALALYREGLLDASARRRSITRPSSATPAQNLGGTPGIQPKREEPTEICRNVLAGKCLLQSCRS